MTFFGLVVFFDFTDVSRGLSKWVAVGDDDILRIKYGPYKGSSRCQTIAVVADDYSEWYSPHSIEKP